MVLMCVTRCGVRVGCTIAANQSKLDFNFGDFEMKTILATGALFCFFIALMGVPDWFLIGCCGLGLALVCCVLEMAAKLEEM